MRDLEASGFQFANAGRIYHDAFMRFQAGLAAVLLGPKSNKHRAILILWFALCANGPTCA